MKTIKRIITEFADTIIATTLILLVLFVISYNYGIENQKLKKELDVCKNR